MLRTPTGLSSLVLVAVATWVLVTNWGPIAAGHPSYLILYLGSLVVGGAVLFSAARRSGPIRWFRSSLGSVCLLLLTGTGWWLSPFPADPAAVEALASPAGLSVDESATYITIKPAAPATGAALIFYPGARVDARAYVRILSPVAEAGYPVVIVKPPLGIAFLARGLTESRIEQDPEIDWVVGGHSLGGVAASSEANGPVVGLLLWASFPASDISGRTGLTATSIYGTADTFATPADIEASQSILPATTSFVAIEGGIHSFFGDYGLQPGDGDPSITRKPAQAEIVAASVELLEAVSAP
jgi:hypothetical protein